MKQLTQAVASATLLLSTVYVQAENIEASMKYGAETFLNRCSLCHGSQGLGDGIIPLSIKNYPNTNLKENHFGRSHKQLRDAVLYGGSKGRMSKEMPPWGDELTYVQVESVVLFLEFLLAEPEKAYKMLEKAPTNNLPSFRLGQRIFKNYCVLCHGKNGEGNGKMAKIIKNPPPFNLTKSSSSDDYLMDIISKGGEAMKRSPRMPPWGDQFSKPEIKSIIMYINSLRGRN